MHYFSHGETHGLDFNNGRRFDENPPRKALLHSEVFHLASKGAAVENIRSRDSQERRVLIADVWIIDEAAPLVAEIIISGYTGRSSRSVWGCVTLASNSF